MHSRRWFGEETNDIGRDKKILELLKDCRNRKAWLVSRFSLCTHNEELFRVAVRNQFEISEEIRGENGFGYDFILVPQKETIYDAIVHDRLSAKRGNEILKNKCTIAELTQEEKNAINNRGRIAKEIRDFFNSHLED